MRILSPKPEPDREFQTLRIKVQKARILEQRVLAKNREVLRDRRSRLQSAVAARQQEFRARRERGGAGYRKGESVRQSIDDIEREANRERVLDLFVRFAKRPWLRLASGRRLANEGYKRKRRRPGRSRSIDRASLCRTSAGRQRC